jgi:pimeloyl-ACP methyl ester carboxylesterase
MAASQILDIDGPVHYVDHGGTGPVMVLVHGLGGSHSNWIALAPRLAEIARVYAVDLVGFGITPPAGRRATVQSNRDMIADFAEAVSPGHPVMLIGNSMGGLISLLAAERYPEVVDGLVLIDPALPPPSVGSIDVRVAQRLAAPLVPGVGERLMRHYANTTPPDVLVQETMSLLCAQPDRVPEDAVEAALAMATLRREMDWAPRAFTEAGRSIAAVMMRRRTFQRLVHRVSCPVLLLHGERDRLVPVEASRRLAAERPDWTFQVFPGVGHVPQIEAPDGVAAAIAGWMVAAAS